MINNKILRKFEMTEKYFGDITHENFEYFQIIKTLHLKLLSSKITYQFYEPSELS